MEKMLLKLARQLDSLDEASLMSLWSKYATLTSRFEPTKRWEEACLIFSLIQAKRWKNQLFNYSWQQKRMPPVKNMEGENISRPPVVNIPRKQLPQDEKPEACKILSFSSSAKKKSEDIDKTPSND